MKRQKIESYLRKRKYEEFVNGVTFEDIIEERYYPYLYF